MKLSDLKVGMRVRLRNNYIYEISGIDNCSITLEKEYLNYPYFDIITRSYHNDLTIGKISGFDIMEVLKFNISRGWETIWKRNVGNDDAQDEWEYIRKGLLEKHSINTQKEEKGMKALYNAIDKVYFNESKRTTTIKFKNGDISKATATVGTEFCEHAGFMAALFKYQYGKVKDLETFIKRKGERQ